MDAKMLGNRTRWIVFVTLLVACRGKGQVDTLASASASASVSPALLPPAPSASPPATKVTIVEKKPGEYRVDDDVPLLLSLSALAGEIPTDKLPTGYRLLRVPEGSLLARLGFKTDDEVVSINGVLLLSVNSLKEAYARVKKGHKVAVVGKRDGASFEHVYQMQRSLSRSTGSRSKAGAAHEKALAALATGVKRVGPSRYRIDRKVLETLEQHPQLLGRRRGYATRVGGSGIRVSSLEPSVYTLLQLQPRDKVTQVGGVAVADPDAFGVLLAKQKTAFKFTIDYERSRSPETHSYEVSRGLVDDKKLKPALAELRSVPGAGLSRRSSSLLARRDFERAVKKRGPYSYEINASDVARHTSPASRILSYARVVPLTSGPERGLKLFGIRPKSPLAILGLQNGDLVQSINGKPIADLDALFDLYDEQPSRLSVGLKRRGKSLTIVYTIKAVGSATGGSSLRPKRKLLPKIVR